jgi:membrane fusion protein (multidrug efflux system)/multidrug efflux system membrane fusion protein/cobalt-zinc-cadmium efflux system membrane fusion protein
MSNRWWSRVTLALGFLILVWGCDFFGSEQENTVSAKKAAVQSEAPAVKVDAVKRADISVPIYATGSVFPDRESKVAAKISGIVEKVFVEEGDHVKEGKLLAQLDQKDLLITERQCRAAVQVAEAQLKEAELRVENLRKEKHRLANLLDKKVVSQQKYDEIDTAYSMAVTGLEVIRAQILSARENLAMARQKLTDTRILAPFSGMIVKRFINQGEYVTTMPPTTLFLLMNIDTVKTEVGLPEKDLSLVAVGDPVDITVDAYPHNTFKGTVSTINPTVDPLSRTFTLKMQIPNKDQRLQPGMFARATIYPEIHENAIVVPFKSVVTSGAHAHVYVLEGDRAKLRKVTVGITDEQQIEVIEGLTEGEVVAVDGHHGMPDNTKVRILKE